MLPHVFYIACVAPCVSYVVLCYCICLSGPELLEKLAETWTQFFTHILPTLEAIFVPTQICIRSVTLLSFRDHVLLKTPISEALDSGEQGDVPPRIKQMLLVLQVG